MPNVLQPGRFELVWFLQRHMHVRHIDAGRHERVPPKRVRRVHELLQQRGLCDGQRQQHGLLLRGNQHTLRERGGRHGRMSELLYGTRLHVVERHAAPTDLHVPAMMPAFQARLRTTNL